MIENTENEHRRSRFHTIRDSELLREVRTRGLEAVLNDIGRDWCRLCLLTSDNSWIALQIARVLGIEAYRAFKRRMSEEWDIRATLEEAREQQLNRRRAGLKPLGELNVCNPAKQARREEN